MTLRTFLPLLLLAAPLQGATITLVSTGGAKLTQPFGTEFDSANDLYFVEMTTNRLRRIDAAGRVHSAAGTGERGFAGDGGPGEKAQLNGPHHLTIAPDGLVLISDTWNNRVRKYDPKTGMVSTFAGTGVKGFGGDGGFAEQAQFGGVYCAAFDPKGETLYVADLDNRRIRAIDYKTRKVSTVAGNGKKGIPTDGARATEAPLVDPRAVAADAKGNIYILERSGNALRVVNSRGEIRTVAGTGQKGLSGDDGPAIEATLNGPKHLCVDREGNVLIADSENHVIRKFIPGTGRIVRVAGTGKKGKAGVGGSALEAELSQPHGVYVAKDGSLYISDSSNHRILKVN